MSAEKLRRAATLLRERAEAATSGPWHPLGRAVRSGRGGQAPISAGQSVAVTSEAYPGTGCAFHAETPIDSREADAAFIALMDPTVALAVADWLDTVAGVHWPERGSNWTSACRAACSDPHLGLTHKHTDDCIDEYVICNACGTETCRETPAALAAADAVLAEASR